MTNRKEFLIAGALGTAAAALPSIAQAAPPAPAATPEPWPKFVFDTKAFDDALDGLQPHKHLFTSVAIDNGLVFGMVNNTLTGYKDIDVTLTDVLPAVVLYHGVAITMGFDDHAWDAYFIPLAAKLKGTSDPHFKPIIAQFDAVLKPGKKGNPFFHADRGDHPEDAIETLVHDNGMRLFMCNLATRGFCTLIGKQLGLKPMDVYNDLAAHMVPSAMLAPSGVWAIHAVQQHKFTLLVVNLA